jgi:hypothetical protein
MNMAIVHTSSSLFAVGKRDATETKRETASEIRRSVWDRIAIHGQTIREVGRAIGLTDRTVTDLLLEAQAQNQSKAIRLAYDNGRRSLLPPCNARRAAA